MEDQGEQDREGNSSHVHPEESQVSKLSVLSAVDTDAYPNIGICARGLLIIAYTCANVQPYMPEPGRHSPL